MKRSKWTFSSSVFAMLCWIAVDAAEAASNYSQNFTSGAQGWSAVVDTWSVQNGYYANASTQEFRSLAVYSGDTWTTGYTYKLSMYADIGSSGANRVGAVFSYQGPGDYYEVMVNMLGEIELSRWQGGERQFLTRGSVPAGVVPGIDQWFDVEIVRTTSNVTVKVGDEIAIQDFPLLTSVNGRIGVSGHHNRVRFDNISVKLAAQPLFKTGFNTNVNLTNPKCFSGTRPSWMVDLVGTENGTGTKWPLTFWGAPDVWAINTLAPCVSGAPEDSPMTNYVVIALKNVTGPSGPTRVLSNTVRRVDLAVQPRAGISYTVGSDGTVPDRYYIRRYLKYSKSYLDNLAKHHWFVQHEFKAASCDLPRRLELKWFASDEAQPKLYYWLRMDQSNNCGVPNEFESVDGIDFKCFPSRGDPCPAVPVDKWFYDEFLVQISRTGTSQDRIAYAIDREIVFDVRMPVRSPPPRGIKLTPGYLNTPNVEVQVDDVEIYAAPPCGTFPCGPPNHYRDAP